ncbi:MAG: HAMP domain-containing histidine kinase [Bacteroidales bacterium]|nr:HAMP domain-containing histidine kinase [Bacteroidales bacterium]
MLKRYLKVLFGSKDEFKYEHRFTNYLAFGTVLIAWSSFIIDLAIKLDIRQSLNSLLTGFFYFIIYIISRVFRKHQLAIWLVLLCSFVVLDILWLTSAGSNGPIPYTFIILLLAIVLLSNKWKTLLLFVIFLINLLIVYKLEEAFPEYLYNYENDIKRKTDVVISIILYSIVCAVIMANAKQNYLSEKIKAIQAEKLKTSFLANVSHEIISPMMSIKGFVQLLQEDNITKVQKEKYHHMIDENLEYLLRIVNDMMDMSRIEADELEILPAKFKIDSLLTSIETNFQQELKSNKIRGVQLSYLNAGSDDTITTDSARLEEILNNLIQNAILYTPKGYVRFGFTNYDSSYTFYVLDTGIGIEEKHLSFIFDRFYRVENKAINYPYKTTGIGLTIAQKMVHTLGGNIWVQSTPGKGSTFYFNLPRNYDEDFRIKN